MQPESPTGRSTVGRLSDTHQAIPLLLRIKARIASGMKTRSANQSLLGCMLMRSTGGWMFRDRAGAGGVMAGVAGSEVGVCGVFACVLLALAEGFDLRSLSASTACCTSPPAFPSASAIADAGSDGNIAASCAIACGTYLDARCRQPEGKPRLDHAVSAAEEHGAPHLCHCDQALGASGWRLALRASA